MEQTQGAGRAPGGCRTGFEEELGDPVPVSAPRSPRAGCAPMAEPQGVCGQHWGTTITLHTNHMSLP